MLLVEKSQIRLNKVRLYAYHGVMEQEQRVGGWYLLTLTIDYPFAKAMESDDVSDTLNYATVLDVVTREMKIPGRLLEHVAGRMAKALITAFPEIDGVDICLTKENPPMGGDTQGASVILYIKNDKNG